MTVWRTPEQKGQDTCERLGTALDDRTDIGVQIVEALAKSLGEEPLTTDRLVAFFQERPYWIDDLAVATALPYRGTH